MAARAEYGEYTRLSGMGEKVHTYMCVGWRLELTFYFLAQVFKVSWVAIAQCLWVSPCLS